MFLIAPDEKIVKTVRKHWFFLAVQAVGLASIFIIPFVLIITLEVVLKKPQFANLFESFPINSKILGALIVLWSLLIWFKLFSIWMDYYLDKWVITTKRIVSVAQKGFFRRQVSSFRIDKIQDISTEVDGLVETFLNYGDIKVQTAGEFGDFTITNVPAPTTLKELISHQQETTSRTAPGL